MSSTTVLFVCSSSTQVRMFLPVTSELAQVGVQSQFISLDQYYGQGATKAARLAGNRVVELRRAGGPLQHAFYRRTPLPIWLDALRAEPIAGHLIRTSHPRAVVLGNDFGLIEKAFIRGASRHQVRTVLVQDGKLGARTRPRQRSAAGRLRRWARSSASALLVRAGFSHLGSTEYGAGGADVICASGSKSAETMRLRAKPGTQIEVTGQPRYDTIVGRARSRSPKARIVAVITTPFADVLGDQVAQRRQDEVLEWVSRSAAAVGGTVTLKPHPREHTDRYTETRRVTVSWADPTQILEGAWFAIVGPSTVVEEAALSACPVISPAPELLGDVYSPFLPPSPPYPRFGSVAELQALMATLLSPEARRECVDAQRAYIAGDLLVVADASARVARAIIGA